MNSIAAAFLGSASLCATLAFYIVGNHIEIVSPLTEWFLNRHGFTAPFYVGIAFIGIVFLSAGRRGSRVAEFIAKTGDTVASFYSSAAGSVFGWSLAICTAAAVDNPERYLLLSIFLVVMMFAMVSAPLGMMVVMRIGVEKFNNQLFRDAWRESFIRVMGWLLIIVALIGLMYDWRNPAV